MIRLILRPSALALANGLLSFHISVSRSDSFCPYHYERLAIQVLGPPPLLIALMWMTL